MVPLGINGIYAKENMEDIYPTIPINISWIPGKIENIYIGVDFSPNEIKIYTELFKEFHNVFSWSYDEIPQIGAHIVEH